MILGGRTYFKTNASTTVDQILVWKATNETRIRLKFHLFQFLRLRGGYAFSPFPDGDGSAPTPLYHRSSHHRFPSAWHLECGTIIARHPLHDLICLVVNSMCIHLLSMCRFVLRSPPFARRCIQCDGSPVLKLVFSWVVSIVCTMSWCVDHLSVGAKYFTFGVNRLFFAPSSKSARAVARSRWMSHSRPQIY